MRTSGDFQLADIYAADFIPPVFRSAFIGVRQSRDVMVAIMRVTIDDTDIAVSFTHIVLSSPNQIEDMTTKFIRLSATNWTIATIDDLSAVAER